jgi:hypothetical protein
MPDSGDLRMGVVGQDGDGLFYRLRDATFEIDGPESTAFSTESNPTTDVISLELAAGSYDVLLADGWRLERWDPISDAALDVDATLVSDNPATALVSGSETVGVVFEFDVPDVGPVVLGDGDLEIDIDVNVEAEPCDPLVQDCDSGLGCYFDNEGYSCQTAGSVGLYDECEFANSCTPGLLCAQPFANSNCNEAHIGCCVAFCSVAAPGCDASEDCVSMGVGDPDIGVCLTI